MILPTGRGLPDWTAGTATATQGQRNITFVGAGLIATDPTTGAQLYAAGRGDLFMIDGLDAVPIAAVIDANTIQLARPWSAATQNGVAYAIIRMSIPASGSVQKAIKDIYDQGSDAKPDVTRTFDDSTARIKIDPHAGAPAIRVGAAGAADAALKEGIAFDKDAGFARFPSGLLLPATGFRNRIINGNFDIWQRGTIFMAAGGYACDRWKVYSSAGNTTISKVVAPAGFIGQNAINIAASAVAAGSSFSLSQRLEAQAVYDLDGQACCISFDINASTGAGSLTGYVQFATSAAPDNGVYSNWLAATYFSIPPGSGRVTALLSAAQTAGLKYGGELLITTIQNEASQNVSVTIGAVQIERGLVANPFEFRPIGAELALCYRYYQTGLFRSYVPDTYIRGTIPIKATMRVAASVSYTDEIGNPNKVSTTLSHNIAIAAGNIILSLGPGDYVCNATLAASAGGEVGFKWTLDSEL